MSTKPATKAENTSEKDTKTLVSDTKTTETTEKDLELAKTVIEGTETTEKAATGSTTTIKLLRSHPKVGAFAGDVTTINAELATELIEGKFAEEHTETEAETEE